MMSCLWAKLKLRFVTLAVYIIKELLLWTGFFYITLRDDFLGKTPCFLKRISYRILLNFLQKILSVFYSECEQILQNVVAHYDEITQLEYNKHSLKDAYKELKTLPLKKIMDPTLGQEINRLKSINTQFRRS